MAPRSVTAKMIVAEKYVDKYIETFNEPPTYREVAKYLGLASVNSAYLRLRRYHHKMKQQFKPPKQSVGVWVKATEVIPKMVHPLGKHWQQPSRANILLNDTEAKINNTDLELLAEYSSSMPTGAYEGKMWKAKTNDGWYLKWYGNSKHPDKVSNNSRKIIEWLDESQQQQSQQQEDISSIVISGGLQPMGEVGGKGLVHHVQKTKVEQQEDKISDEEIHKMAEKEIPEHKYKDMVYPSEAVTEYKRASWFNGFKACLQKGSATDYAESIIKLINDFWKFDNNQQPISSWYDKQDLLEIIIRKTRNIKSKGSEDKIVWTDELLVMYAEAHRFSSGRISLKQFKEMIGTEWDKPLRKTAKELLKEWEKGSEDKIGKAIEWCEQLEINPYPEDIFLPVSEVELKSIHEMLKEKFNMPIDRLTGHIGRLLRKPIIEDAIEMKHYLTTLINH